MKTISHSQGSPGWHAARAWPAHCASDAAAAMGQSPYKPRTDLLREKATGDTPEVDAATQARFDQGHATEAAARAILEAEIDDDLYPVTATDDAGYLLASSDGVNMTGDIGFEHKLWSEKRAAALRAGDLLPQDWPQAEQNIRVFGLDKIIFVVSDGTAEKRVMLEYRAVPGRIEKVMAAWAQFDADLANYQHVEYLPAQAGTSTATTLPALIVRAKGEITESNFAEYKKAALAMIGAIKTDLETDADFDDAAATVKDCVKAEENLQAMKRLVLGGMADVQTLLDGLDELDTAVSKKRTFLKNLIESRRVARRAEIVAKGQAMYTAHIESLKAETGGPWIVLSPPDFAGAVKGLRTIASQQNAVDTALANGKIAADASAKLIRANLACMKDDGAGYEFLFRDSLALINKPIDDLRIIIKSRIDAHKAAEQKKADELRQKIEAEVAAKAQADKEAAERAEQERLQAAQVAPSPVATPAIAPVAAQPAPIEQPAAWGLQRTATVQTLPSRQRPSAAEIIEAVALHFQVSAATAADWLRNTDASEYAGWPKSA